jgi:hypothetical protein
MAAVPLIVLDGGTYTLADEGVALLQSLQRKVAVIVVCGKVSRPAPVCGALGGPSRSPA